jgi:hypothetical protein
VCVCELGVWTWGEIQGECLGLSSKNLKLDQEKPRKLSVHESEECEDGEGVGVYSTLLQSSDTYLILNEKTYFMFV